MYTVMHLRVRGIDFVSFYGFSIGFVEKLRQCGICFPDMRMSLSNQLVTQNELVRYSTKSTQEQYRFFNQLVSYHFTVNSLRLATTPFVFERLTKYLLRGLQWDKCLLCMTYIIIPVSTFEEHIFIRHIKLHIISKECKHFGTCCLQKSPLKY